jgi:hypothetical protein
LPPDLLKIGAGAAQIASNTGMTLNKSLPKALIMKNHGDNPEDQLQILKGINYAESLNISAYPKSINPNFHTVIEDLENYRSPQELNNYINNLWNDIPANNIYQDKNNRHHQKIMDLNDPEVNLAISRLLPRFRFIIIHKVWQTTLRYILDFKCQISLALLLCRLNLYAH